MGAQADLTAAEAVAVLLGQAVVGVAPLGGAYRIRLADDTTVVAKRHLQRSAVEAEVAGLRWLKGDRGPRVPAVVAFDDQWLTIEVVPAGRPSWPVAEEFGRDLATLHHVGADAFGVAPPGGPADAWIGLAPMRNVAGARWPEWYAEHRVLPYVRKAVDLGVLPEPAVIEGVCARIGDIAGPEEPPARLHGDLWNGNVLWGDGHVWLIDPAAHGGHRETDLAMLHLFGCTHLDRIVAAYDESAPLADGWRERIPLHQLFPLLVHTVLFGGGYGARAVAAARSLA